MGEKRISVRLAAVGGEKLKAELVGIGKAGKQALAAVAGGAAPASQGLKGVGAASGTALVQLEALAVRATRAATALRAAGASTGTLVERIDRITGVTPGFRRSAEDIAAYGRALDDTRAKFNPLFAVIRDYKSKLAEIRQAHVVGAISADEMRAAISRERQATLQSIAAIKGRTTALTGMGRASRMAAFQSRMLMFQLNDVFVSLASGMNPMMVFIQQGAQIQQIYAGQGGVRAALAQTARMIGNVVTRFPLLTAAIAAGTAAVAGMRHEINRTSKVAVSFGDTALAVWQVMRDGLWQKLKPAIDAIAPWFARGWEMVVSGTKIALNAIIKGFLIAKNDIAFAWATLPEILGAAVVGTANAVIGGLEWMVNTAIEKINWLADQVNALMDKAGAPEAMRIGKIGSTAFPRLDNPMADEVARRLKRLNDDLARIMASDPMGDFFDAVKARAVANALNKVEKAVTGAGKAASKAAEVAKSAWETAANSLKDYATKAMDLGKGLGDSLVGAFRSAENAIGEFVKTGKLDFRSLVTSILADMAKLSARRFILGPLANALSGALGGIGAPGGVLANVFHSGGVVGAGGQTRAVPALAFAGAPRMHAGGWAGLRPDEVPAILQRGERVLSRREVAAGVGSAQNITINIQTRDAESFRQSRAQVAADIARAVALGRRGM